MSPRSIKAVAVDVDGTLLDSDHLLRDAVKAALCDLAANGIQVILATARGPKILGAVLRLLPISPLLVCFSGAWVGEIDRESLNPTREILDRRHSMGVARSIVADGVGTQCRTERADRRYLAGQENDARDHARKSDYGMQPVDYL